MIYRPYRLLLILLVWFLVATRPLPLQAETDQPTPTPAMPAALARISANNANKVALLKTFTEPKVWVVGVTFSPNGALFAGVEDGGNVYVWQTATSKLIGQINYDKANGDPASNIVFSADGTLLIAANPSNFTIDVWNLTDILSMQNAKPKLTLRGHNVYVRTLAISHDGQLLASLDDNGTAIVWNLEAGMQIESLKTGCGGPGGLAFSPNARLLVSACGPLKFWRVDTRQLVKTLPGGHSIAFSPDGKLYAFDHNDTIEVRETSTSRHIFSLRSSESFADVYAITFSPDGSLIVAGSPFEHMVFWEAETGKQLAVVDTGGISSIAFSPDMTVLATGNGGSGMQEYIYWWGINSGS